jgi:hypothetical protein
MSELWTDDEIEAMLEFETRTIPLPEGGHETVSGPKLLWDAVDFIIKTYTHTMPELVALTRKTMASKGYSFEDAFKSVVSYIDQAINGKRT